jgi:CHAT domain-containing protein
LGISAKDTRMFRVPYRNIGPEIAGYLRLCADRQAQNADYPGFAGRSYHLYQLLLEPLQWKKGRILVCPDDFFIPFEALSSDTAGRHFLIEDFTFDYVYSARYLMHPVQPSTGDGNFLGIAPALFQPGMQVPDLPQSVPACRQAAAYYPGADLLMEKQASRQRFLQLAARYSVMNVYTHARSNSDDKEPLLYLADSVIRMSELPLLQQPATQLIVLSACQTNTGKDATGEGIYSLARGFAAAGIPAVAATLWQADEQSIYAITADFHRRLALGMDKDEALRDSKLEYIRTGGPGRSLPFFWANMILIGNTHPLVLTRARPNTGWWAEGGLLLLTVLLLALQLRRRRTAGHRPSRPTQRRPQAGWPKAQHKP